MRSVGLDSPSPARGSAGSVRARNISVAVRVRPIVEREIRRGIQPDACCWSVSVPSELTDKRSGEVWRFDSIFGPEHSTLEVFQSCGRDIVTSFCAGYNGTIFAYGQTASGKTFTMQGNGRGQPGIIPLAVDEIFETICAQTDTQFIMSVSFVEIYNEQVFDLLSHDMCELRIFESAEGTVDLQNCTKARVTTGPKDILACLDRGNDRKHIGETKMNERSSRSHTILQVHLESQRGETVRKSQLNLVDLAGSEGLRHTEAEGVRRREGANINKSLFALSRVISSLSDPGGGKQVHVRFRDSKLTHLLKSSLGGNAQTVVICSISPAPENYGESRSTLQFAGHAKNVQNKVSVNVFSNSDQCLIQSLRNDISELAEQLQRFAKTEPEALRTARAEQQGLMKDKESLENRIHVMESWILQGRKLKIVSDAQPPGPPVVLDCDQRRRRTITVATGELQPAAFHDGMAVSHRTAEDDVARLQLDVQVARAQAEDAERRLRECKESTWSRRPATNVGVGAQKQPLDTPSRNVCDSRRRSMFPADDEAVRSDAEAVAILISKVMGKFGGVGAEFAIQHTGAATTTADMRIMLQRLCGFVSAASLDPGSIASQHSVPCDSSASPGLPLVALPLPNGVSSRVEGAFSSDISVESKAQTFPAVIDAEQELKLGMDQAKAARKLSEAQLETACLRRELEAVRVQQAQQAQERSHELWAQATVDGRVVEWSGQSQSQSVERTLTAKLADVNQRRQDLTDKLGRCEVASCKHNLGHKSDEASLKEVIQGRRVGIDEARFQLKREKELAASRNSIQAESSVKGSHVSTVQSEALKARAKTQSLQDEAAAMRTKQEEAAADVSRLELEFIKERSQLQRDTQQRPAVADLTHQAVSDAVPFGTALMRRSASATFNSTPTSREPTLPHVAPHELRLTPSGDAAAGSVAAQLKRHQGKLSHMQEEFAEADSLRAALAAEVAAQQRRANVLVARLGESSRQAAPPCRSSSAAPPEDAEGARRVVLQQAAAEREAVRRQTELELERVAGDVAQMRQQVLSVSQAEREEQSLQARRSLLETEQWRARTKVLRSELELETELLPDAVQAPCGAPARSRSAALSARSRSASGLHAGDTIDSRSAGLSRFASVQRCREASGKARDNDGCQQQ